MCLTLSNFWATELTWIIFLAAAVVSNHTASSGGLTYFCAHRFVSPCTVWKTTTTKKLPLHMLCWNGQKNSFCLLTRKFSWQKNSYISTLWLLYTCVLLSILFDITSTPPANCFLTSWNHKGLVPTDIGYQNNNLKNLIIFVSHNFTILSLKCTHNMIIILRCFSCIIRQLCILCTRQHGYEFLEHFKVKHVFEQNETQWQYHLTEY